MALDWKKEISLSTITDLFGSKKNKNSGSSTYPSKTTMNLYQSEKRTTDVRKVIALAVLLVVAVGLFLKFGVLDQLALVSAKEAELSKQQALVLEMKAGSVDYEQMKETYDAYMARYGEGNVDANMLLDMIERQAKPAATVSAIVFADNTLTITLYNATLETAGNIAKDLESQPMVAKSTVTTATMDNGDGQNSVSTIVLTLVGSEGGEE